VKYTKEEELERFEKFKEKWILWDSIDKPLRISNVKTKYTVRNGSFYKRKFIKDNDDTKTRTCISGN
tara:strand:- start:2851 stop:3051 length:201 start_codon:yes stop_codon:yes gene_type:complete